MLNINSLLYGYGYNNRKAFYKNLRKERKKEWKRNNPDQKMTSYEDIDYQDTDMNTV